MEGEERCRRGMQLEEGKERKEKVRGIMNLEYIESDVYISQGLAGCQLGFLYCPWPVNSPIYTNVKLDIKEWTLKICAQTCISTEV